MGRGVIKGGVIRIGWLVLFAAAAVCAPPAPAAPFFVSVAGLGGEPEYDQRFQLWAQEVERVLKSDREAKIETLSGARSTRENVRAALARIAAEAGPSDALVVMMLGHGTYDGMDYKINLPGPDLSAAELASMLDRIPAGRQLVVNMTSCSGGANDVLAKPTRAVISATKSGTEKNATIFARYWVEALGGQAADFDKNQTISAAEAFRYAKEKTARFYETERRLATEHAVLTGETAASGFVLVRHGATAALASDPAKRKLLARREEIEQQIDRLKLSKTTTPAAEYKKQLADLLVELARTQEELEK